MNTDRRKFLFGCLGAIAGAAAAVVVPLRRRQPAMKLPSNIYIRGPKYRVMFTRLTTPRIDNLGVPHPLVGAA